jgi:hypothetical protein
MAKIMRVYDGSQWIEISSSSPDLSNALAFGTVTVAGQSNVVADTLGDTLTLVAGTNIVITTNAATDTITISALAGAGDAAFSDFLLMGG